MTSHDMILYKGIHLHRHTAKQLAFPPKFCACPSVFLLSSPVTLPKVSLAYNIEYLSSRAKRKPDVK